MNLLVKILNNSALTSAKCSETASPVLAWDEPKMPESMVK